MVATTTEAQTVVSTKIIEAPSLETVLNSERRDITLRVARFTGAILQDEVMDVACSIEKFDLELVRNITLSSNENCFSFEADHVYRYEHSSYGQSSTRAERTSYRIIVHRGFKGWDHGTSASLLQI